MNLAQAVRGGRIVPVRPEKRVHGISLSDALRCGKAKMEGELKIVGKQSRFLIYELAP
jgi:hypothetical protein